MREEDAKRLGELLNDPKFIEQFTGQFIPAFKRAISQIAATFGIGDSRQFLEYIGIFATIWTAISASDMRDFSEDLKGLTQTLIQETQRLKRANYALISLTVVLILFTILLLLRAAPL